MQHLTQFQYYQQFVQNEWHPFSKVSYQLNCASAEAFFLQSHVLHGIERLFASKQSVLAEMTSFALSVQMKVMCPLCDMY